MIFHLNDYEQWQPVMEQLRVDNQRIASTNGTFDIVHSGHLLLLKAAKEQGDVLVVGLNSDASVKSYKSEKRPIVPQAERAAMMQAIRYVDHVMIFDEPDSGRFVKELQPDVHVKDSTYGYDLLEAPIVEAYGGKIHLVEKDGNSTTNIIEKILDVYRDEDKV